MTCPKKTKSLKENWLLIFQSSSFKMDSNRKLPNFGLFCDKQVCSSQTPKKCANIIADSETFTRYVVLYSIFFDWVIYKKIIVPKYNIFIIQVRQDGQFSSPGLQPKGKRHRKLFVFPLNKRSFVACSLKIKIPLEQLWTSSFNRRHYSWYI